MSLWVSEYATRLLAILVQDTERVSCILGIPRFNTSFVDEYMRGSTGRCNLY